MIAIVHTELGNTQSVANALESLGCSIEVTDRPERLREATHIILPGVGAFGEGAEVLERKNLTGALRAEVIEKKKPFLGICLGMQLLASVGFESGRHEGLNWIEGSVEKMEPEDRTLRLPHVGWNEVSPTRSSRLFEGLDSDPMFYFVHSYHLKPKIDSDTAGICHYGIPFTAVVERANIAGVQFHPEKSQLDGLKLLRNFIENFR